MTMINGSFALPVRLCLASLFAGACAPPAESWRQDALVADAPESVRNAYANYTANMGTAQPPTDALAALGQFYHANGYPAAARTVYSALENREPVNARWPYLTALTHIEAGAAIDAESHLRQATMLAPTHALAWWHRGFLAFYRGNTSEAEAAFTEALRHDSTLAHAHLGRARVQISRAAWTEAATSLRAAIAIDANLPTAYTLLAQTQRALGHEIDARRIEAHPASRHRYYDPVDPEIDRLRDHCFDVDRLQLAADAEFTALRGSRALPLIKRALQLDPDSAELAFTLGKIHLAENRIDLAFHWLETAVRLDPHLTEAHRVIAFETLRQGAPEKALGLIERGIATNPASPALLHFRALCLKDRGDLTAAENDLRRALELAPQNPEFLQALADLLWEDHRPEEAAPFYETLRTLAPQSLSPLLRLAHFHLSREHWEAADTCLDAATQLAPDDTAVSGLSTSLLVRRGNWLNEQGRAADAAALFASALAIDPSSLPALESLCLGLMRANRFDQAQEVVREFIGANPRLAKPRYLLAVLLSNAGEFVPAQQQLVEAKLLAVDSGDADLVRKIQALQAQVTRRR